MRSTFWARWATCAIAITAGLPTALADRQPRSLNSCTSFEQSDTTEAAMQFTISSSCTVPIECKVRWRVVCAPASKTRRATHTGSVTMSLGQGGSSSAEASASACGDDAWTLDDVVWSCEPKKE